MSVKLNVKVNVNDLGVMEEELNLDYYRPYILSKIDDIVREKIRGILEIDYKGDLNNRELNNYIDEKVIQLFKEQDFELLLNYIIKKKISDNLIKVINKRCSQKNIERLLKEDIDGKLMDKYNLYSEKIFNDVDFQKKLKKEIEKEIEERMKRIIK